MSEVYRRRVCKSLCYCEKCQEAIKPGQGYYEGNAVKNPPDAICLKCAKPAGATRP